jgi:catechol 2,3-dioxygenase-like lactoylglutathione lyase family enzyme
MAQLQGNLERNSMNKPKTENKGLFHVAIKTADVEESDRFYIDVIGLKKIFRPPMPFPGSWFAMEESGFAMIHTYGGGPAHIDGVVPFGTAAVDHIALLCRGWDGFMDRVKQSGRDWRAQLLAGTTMWQIYVHDPSGTMFELTFMADNEDRSPPEIEPSRHYYPDERWGPFAPNKAKPA